MSDKLTYGSLFSGVGGFDMGFDYHMDCAFQVEWDKHCQAILAKHWPDVPKWNDVCDVNGADLPPCDVLTFGSPCQDLSVAGKRAGLDGTKSSMFFEAIRIIKEMRNATRSESTIPFPRVAIWENVAGALSSNNGHDFGAVLDSLAEIGAVDIEWHVLDARWFGIPQRRRRVFVVAIFDPAISERCAENAWGSLLPVAQSGFGDTPTRRASWQSATGTTQDSVTTDSRTGLVGALAARDYKGVGNQYVDKNKLVVEPFVKGRRAQTVDDYETWRNDQTAPTLNAFDNAHETRATVLFTAQRVGEQARMYENESPTLQARMGTGGNNTPMVAQPVAYSIREDAKANNFSATETDTALALSALQPSVQSHHAQLFITQPLLAFDTQFGSNAKVFEDESPTLKASQASPSVTQDMIVRRLTPIECERLMGWPDDHTRWRADGTEQSDSQRYKQCGNGVATPVAAWIAKYVKAVLLP